MSSSVTTEAKQAFTLIELLVVIAIIAILVCVVVPMRNVPDRVKSTQCISNLRQVSLGYILWADANTNQFPWEASTNAGGTLELSENGNAALNFLPIAAALSNPRLLVCPMDKIRQASTNFTSFGNSNLSYFASLAASLKSSPSRSSIILAGDRHLSFNNQALKAGLFEMAKFAGMGWTTELHNNAKNSASGVLAFSDGHCEVVRSNNLSAMFQRQSLAANRLVLP